MSKEQTIWRGLKVRLAELDKRTLTMKKSIACAFTVGMLLLAGCCTTRQGPSVALTDITLTSVNASGNYTGPDVWDTRPGGSFNIWIQNASTGSFLNGPADSGARPHIKLAPGVTSFRFFVEPGADYDQFGINLFFNGSNQPSISAMGPMLTHATAKHVFSANGGSTTLAANQDRVAGAGTLSYTCNNYLITLTDFHLARPSVYGLDSIGEYATKPSDHLDYVGGFTLSVVPVHGSRKHP